MANKRKTNGVLDTLQRLFGHDEQRSLLTKYAKTGIFKDHLEPSKGITFKRSSECDNLIKNVLALDVVLGSQEEVEKIVKGEISKRFVNERLIQEKSKLDAKFKAYGYWLNRIDSLQDLLESGFDLQSAALEDELSPSISNSYYPSSSPYALRAVKLLERIEEDGRNSKLDSKQLTEKAWALYNLGLHDQANKLAKEITSSDPTSSEAWMLQVLDMHRLQSEASREQLQYSLERENAEPLSSHERWAEEMQEDAFDKFHKAKTNERSLIFPAFLYWPEDHDSRIDKYKQPEARKQIRNGCIDWLFTLLTPYNNYCFQVDHAKLHEINGLSPEFEYKESQSSSHLRTDLSAYPAHGLTDIEVQAAKLICEDIDTDKYSRHSGVDGLHLKLKLLHIRYALNLDGYQESKEQFLKNLEYARSSDILQIQHNYYLFSAFVTHLSSDGSHSLQQRLDSLEDKVKKENDERYSLIKLNLLRKSYDHAYCRNQFDDCLAISQQSLLIAPQSKIEAPKDLSLSPLGISANNLSEKFWRYLALKAATQADVTESNFDEVKSVLLSVENPKTYFSDEKEYMIVDCDEYDDYYFPAYGDSIIETGEWLNALQRLSSGPNLSEQDQLITKTVMTELESLILTDDSWSN
ncbi:hypothetical protein [Neptuniibacter sp. 2_MG-2023]|uniref:hypothetical protein n=1 Tax=Neptuniibacter sp. 2_MG-2023 TaxID=3062671 RepID=UPI0026E24134|nr:hypothetical protein [Neptuniibacter sp. 2_MG-2023]MDO6514474.1 hypothetical protein [Neptuniibacter sp. 2_MG-2023]